MAEKIKKKLYMKSAFGKLNAKYAVNMDAEIGQAAFEYVIGDDYKVGEKIPEGFGNRIDFYNFENTLLYLFFSGMV